MTTKEKTIHLTLKIWRQPHSDAPGRFVTYESGPVSTDLSFLELLDVINERLTLAGEEPVAFEHDCREGICGACGAVLNGTPHGPAAKSTLCQTHLRNFKDGDTLVLEPFRARAFRVEKDLVIDRSALDAIIQAGGYVSVNAGSAPEANTLPVPEAKAEEAMNSAECIGCGACIAACPNSAAMLFTGAKVSQLALLPQGQPERARRALALVRAMDTIGFGHCSNERECQTVCPKGIKIGNIARLTREFLRASFFSTEE